ncbi:PAS domain-containing sensor histidine kinase [Chryseolinea lacunae]|uniref:histidine kinase n=1 Tax=Chryseolinea lacunae TaxID=2801331 RepID=A0ABS1KP40_9BACT|nr:two-component sensor histidine kinase [Chryseolinea lacunae]
MSEPTHNNTEHLFLRDGGEMGELILNVDWANSALGPIDQWPQSLKTNLGNLLHSGFPMFLFWGPDNLCFYNDAYRPSLGREGKHPAIGKPAKEVWPELWDFIGSLIHSVNLSGKPQWFENQLLPIYRNGHLEDVYWTFSYSPAYGEHDRIGGVLVTCMETTQTVLARKKIEETVAERTRELKIANEAITLSNSYLQDIINSFKQPLQVLEPVYENGKIIDFRFKLTNKAYASYAHESPGSIQHRRVSEIFPGYLKTTSFSNVVKTFETGEQDTWIIHYDQDGLDLYNEMTAIKMGDEVILHFADFTKLKHLELELLKKIEELEISNQNLEAFAHAASHDLKEPVRKIQIFAGRLRSALKKSQTPLNLEPLDKIENAAERMGHLIDDLLLYSEFHIIPLQKEPVDLNERLNQVIDDFEIYIQEKNASIQIGPLPIVPGYARQLQQMFQNLIGNALKYNRPDEPPHIVISARPHQENGKLHHIIEVADNGIGFDQQYAERIFQMFARLHGNGTYTGSGIGLSIVKKVVDNHEGHIEVASTLGQGSTFKVYLPAE